MVGHGVYMFTARVLSSTLFFVRYAFPEFHLL